MGANAQPIFVGELRNESCTVVTGTDLEDGTGTTELFAAHATNGSRIHAISGVYFGSVSTNTVLRLWIESATSYILIAEIALPLYTKAAGSPSPVLNLLDYVSVTYIDPADRFLTLDAGDTIYVSVVDTIESNLHITAFGGDY